MLRRIISSVAAAHLELYEGLEARLRNPRRMTVEQGDGHRRRTCEAASVLPGQNVAQAVAQTAAAVVA